MIPHSPHVHIGPQGFFIGEAARCLGAIQGSVSVFFWLANSGQVLDKGDDPQNLPGIFECGADLYGCG